MISYSYPEEKEFIAFFSEKIGEPSIPKLLESNASISREEAIKISVFFWKMIDLGVELQNTEECPWPEGYEFWSEKVLQSVAAFLKQSGHGTVLREMSTN